jgi:hypothetical protein
MPARSDRLARSIRIELGSRLVAYARRLRAAGMGVQALSHSVSERLQHFSVRKPISPRMRSLYEQTIDRQAGLLGQCAKRNDSIIRFHDFNSMKFGVPTPQDAKAIADSRVLHGTVIDSS